jgi:hypothetical protein
MRRLCVPLDDEDHRVARERPEADGPHVAQFLAEGGVHAVGVDGLMGLVATGVAGSAGVGEIDSVAPAFDGPDRDLVGSQMGGVGCSHPLASSANWHAA